MLVARSPPARVLPRHGAAVAADAAPLIASSDLLSGADDSLTAALRQAVLDLSLFILLNPTYSLGLLRARAELRRPERLDQALQDVNQRAATVAARALDYGAALYSLRGAYQPPAAALDAALDDYTQSITIQPTDAGARERGLLHARKNDYPSALKDLNNAIGLDASNPALYIYRGWSTPRCQDSAGGRRGLSAILQPDPARAAHAASRFGQTVTLHVDQGVVYIVPFTGESRAVRQRAGGGPQRRCRSADGADRCAGQALAGDDDGGGNSTR